MKNLNYFCIRLLVFLATPYLWYQEMKFRKMVQIKNKK